MSQVAEVEVGRHQSFEVVVDRLRAESERKVDVVLVENRQMEPVFQVEDGIGIPRIAFETGGLAPRLDGRSLEIQEHAHRQLAAKAGIPWMYYQKMLEKAPDLWVGTMKKWWEVDGEASRLVRTFGSNGLDRIPEGGMVRAFLSDRFRVLDNLPFVERVLGVASKHGASIQEAHVDDERVNLRLVTPRTVATERGDLVQGGIAVRNSEVGSGKICIQPFALYLACTNGMISSKNYSRVHLGGELDPGILTRDTIMKMNDAVWSEIVDYTDAAMGEVGDDLQGFVTRLNEAEKVEVGEPRLAVANVVQGNALTSGEGRSILDQYLRDSHQNGETMFGVVQAVTRVAQKAPTHRRQVELEEVGTKMLEMTKTSFTRMVEGNLSEKKVEKILGGMN